ncbi:MAG: hypothetical protein EP350_04435 [Alphaproteobacteria bacterium]|nr:MAG: hypothetical protein EP350_04435 [Alphaproteobacteria bacterium]
MKKIIAIAALGLVAACNQAEAPAEPADTEEAAPAADFVPAADGGPGYGQFRIIHADGSVSTDDVREDGTYTTTMADGTVETGKWVQKPGEYCATPDTEGAVEECYPEKIDENGKWVSNNPKTGETVTVERVVEEAAAE